MRIEGVVVILLGAICWVGGLGAAETWGSLFARYRTLVDAGKSLDQVGVRAELEANVKALSEAELPAAVTALARFASRQEKKHAGWNHTDLAVRSEALRLLGLIAERRSDLVVPVLVQSLGDRDMRASALGEVERLGPLAKDALPQVIALFSTDLRHVAVEVLVKIGPAARAALPTLKTLKVPTDDFDTPLVLPEVLATLEGPLLDAWERCERAQTADVVPKVPVGVPVLVLHHVGHAWELATTSELGRYPKAFAPPTQQGPPAVLCIDWGGPQETGLRYTDGTFAASYSLDLRLVRFADSALAARSTFRAAPSSTKLANMPHPVDVPWREIANWLEELANRQDQAH